jgi:tetratricopeptide (TPR) repeat protein
MPMIKRSCLKANNCLQNGQYREAASEYDSILSSKEAADLSPEQYGDILHNMAVAKMHISGLKEAPELFCQAFERNHREESLRQYLYALRLVNNDILYKEKVEEYQIDETVQKSIAEYLEQKSEEAKFSEMMVEIQQLKQRKSQGRMNEYYKMTDEMIDSWKAKVRQI